MSEATKKDDVILQVNDLHVSFKSYAGYVRAVRGVDFTLHKGETIAIVGESGSGKSVSVKTIMGILSKNAVIDSGEILYDGMDLTKEKEETFHKIRGKRIGLIFQDPLSALNPIMKIGKQITEVLTIEQKMKKEDAKKKAIELMRAVGIPQPEVRFEQYPFQFSGGMRQRGRAQSLRHLHHPRPGGCGQYGRPGVRDVRRKGGGVWREQRDIL